jgi:hypothetical protein
MRNIYVLKAIFLLFLMNFLEKANAQCPASVTAIIASQTLATCPSNATVIIGSNANGVATATYQALTAPSGVGLSPQSSNVFTSLPAGNYTFKVVCGASSATVNTIITTTYTQLAATTTITNVCTSYIAGGTITVSPTGGTSPYNYSLLKTTNANYNDSLSAYGSSNILNPTDSGIYQVRIKDNCGNFITKTVIIQPTTPSIYLISDFLDNDQPCGSGNIRLYYHLSDISGAGLSSADMPFGYKVDIYQKGISCTRGAFIKTVNKLQNSSDRMIIPINQDLYIKVTNSCGDTSSVCYIYPTGTSIYKIHWNLVQTGCSSAIYPNGLITLGDDYSEYGKGPELYSVIKLDGTVVRAPTIDSAIFHNLPYDTYVVVGQDACGAIAKDTLIPPAPGATVVLDDWQDLDCTNQTGTLKYHAFISGYLLDLEHAVITITSGPSNVGVVAFFYNQLGVIEWVNMLPGNYTASVVTTCGTTMVNFSVIPYITPLQQSLQVTTQQACNNGGVIMSTLNYNGVGTTSFSLYNASNINIANNATGLFSGIVAGNYTVKAKIQLWGSCLGSYTIDKPVNILPDGTPPQVVKKIVMICEDVVGNPLANGKAIFRSLGFAPFKVEAKKVIEPDANYVLKYAASVTDFTVDNLLPNENYRVRITDQCGSTAITDVSVGVLEQLTAINNGTPCVNNLYTLAAPDMIDATYTWRKGSTIIATSREIIFPNYLGANDGTYTCTISIGGGCVTRTVTNVLNGISCVVLPINVEDFSVNFANCKTQLNWKITNSTGIAKIDLERSNNGIDFELIKSFPINGTSNIVQNFVDANLNAYKNYYRLLITDNDGKKLESKIVSIKNNCADQKSSLTIYPNPIFKGNDINIIITTGVSGITALKLLNSYGQLISTKTIITKIGKTSTTISSADIKSGVYVVSVVLANGETLIQKIIKE